METKNPMPEAYIAVSAARKPIYSQDSKKFVYLEDGTEFQIELFNPTYKVVGIKLYLNDNLTSNSMLVLRPGERTYLNRFLDKDRKFLFNKYVIENTPESISAISKNGLVKIEFYEEHTPINYGPTWIQPNIYNPYNQPPSTSPNINLPYCGTTSTATLSANNIFNSTSYSIAGNFEVETGRVEMGGESGQKFDQAEYTFHLIPAHTVEYQIMPAQPAPKQYKTNEIRRYCTGCGTRVRKSSWNFCPSCGTKV
jgi:hypothetical protein